MTSELTKGSWNFCHAHASLLQAPLQQENRQILKKKRCRPAIQVHPSCLFKRYSISLQHSNDRLLFTQNTLPQDGWQGNPPSNDVISCTSTDGAEMHHKSVQRFFEPMTIVPGLELKRCLKIVQLTPVESKQSFTIICIWCTVYLYISQYFVIQIQQNKT